MPAIIFSKRYDISFFGFERLHPFDSRKYGRAWTELRREFGSTLYRNHIVVDRAVSDSELLLVHSPKYLERIRASNELANALEVPALRRLPGWFIRWRMVRPMRWAVRGSVLAAKAAMQTGLAVNLSGGYHHAKPDRGEGFCIFSDIALIVRQLRAEGLIRSPQRIAYIDLDAHQGNGVCHQFMEDREVFIFDMYNASIYPAYDRKARDRIDCDLPLPSGCVGNEYLRLLKTQLPPFLDSVASSGRVALGIYNAGTDVFQEDKLGGMALTANDVLDRDLFVIGQFQARKIPVVMLPSGGYSNLSYRLIASTVRHLLDRTTV